MCMGSGEFGFGGPPYGIPIEKKIHRLYSDELKLAWRTFDAWWKLANKAAAKNGGQIHRNSMPAFVKAAMDLICSTPIPTMSATGAQSCYMKGIEMEMVD
jgi:hypothetical protein